MSLVKVWNDNIYPHKEMYKGSEVTIPAGGFVEMDYHEGLQFAGQFTQIVKQADGRDDPKFFKKIRVERPVELKAEGANLICHATGQKATTAEELAALLKEVAHMRVTDPEAEKLVAAEKRAETDLLKARIDELSRLVEDLRSADVKRGPGRPRKEANG